MLQQYFVLLVVNVTCCHFLFSSNRIDKSRQVSAFMKLSLLVAGNYSVRLAKFNLRSQALVISSDVVLLSSVCCSVGYYKITKPIEITCNMYASFLL